MGVTIYGATMSTCTQRVLLTAIELGVQYELKDVNMMKGEHKAPDYISQFHPFGRLPALEDGSTRIFESRAICKYLDAKYGKANALSSDLKGDPAQLGLLEQTASVEYSYFDTASSNLAYEKMFKGFMGKGGPDQEQVDKHTDNLTLSLDYYDNLLSKQPYLAGQSFGLVDVYTIPWVYFIETHDQLGLKDELTSRKNLQSWWKRVTGRESWQKLLKVLG